MVEVNRRVSHATRVHEEAERIAIPDSDLGAALLAALSREDPTIPPLSETVVQEGDHTGAWPPTPWPDADADPHDRSDLRGSSEI